MTPHTGMSSSGKGGDHSGIKWSDCSCTCCWAVDETVECGSATPASGSLGSMASLQLSSGAPFGDSALISCLSTSSREFVFPAGLG